MLKFFHSVQIYTVPECSRLFQNVSECMQNISECMQNVPESMQHVPDCMQIYEFACRSMSLHDITQACMQLGTPSKKKCNKCYINLLTPVVPKGTTIFSMFYKFVNIFKKQICYPYFCY